MESLHCKSLRSVSCNFDDCKGKRSVLRVQGQGQSYAPQRKGVSLPVPDKGGGPLISMAQPQNLAVDDLGVTT